MPLLLNLWGAKHASALLRQSMRREQHPGCTAKHGFALGILRLHGRTALKDARSVRRLHSRGRGLIVAPRRWLDPGRAR